MEDGNIREPSLCAMIVLHLPNAEQQRNEEPEGHDAINRNR